jgi:hypothetical protein
MKIIIIFILINTIALVVSFHLNNYQIQLINNLLQKPQLEPEQREKIHLLLYKAYEKMAIKRAFDFKALHKRKCKTMKNEELILSSKIGLFKAIQKYNGKYDFFNYSTIYINSELLKLLTDHYALSSLPKSYRIKGKGKEDEKKDYSHLLHVTFSIQYEQWQVDSIFKSNEDIVSKINNKYEKETAYSLLVDNDKRFFYLKYYFHEGKILSNKHVSTLMCCSEETVRKKCVNFKF